MNIPRSYDPHGGRKTDAERVRELLRLVNGYESLLHRIQLFAEVTLNPRAVKTLIMRICTWSYAHRRGNGELSWEEQDAHVDRAFRKFADPV